MKSTFWIGSYAQPGEDGLLRCAYDPAVGFTPLAGEQRLLNPSYLILHPDLPVVYTVEETAEGAVCAWRGTAAGLEQVSRLPSGGADPCHLALSEDRRWLYAANYTGGSVACFSVGADGSLTARTDLKQHTGHSVNPLRQEAAHAHFVFSEGNRVTVCDLGMDCLVVYENRGGALTESCRVPVPAGRGPRHLAVSPLFPDLLYCVTELAATVLVFRRGAEGGLTLVAECPVLGRQPTAEETAAAIHFTADGKRLLVSLRGPDAIGVMTLGAEGMPGAPTLSPCVRVPRDFLILGEDVLAASQKDGVLQAYRLDGERLVPLPWRMEAPCPVCLRAGDASIADF